MPEPQYMIALHKANRVRLDRAAMKREIHANDRMLMRVIREPPECMLSCSVSEALCAQRRWGITRARKFLLPFGISESRKIEELTTRQRELICEALEHRRSARGSWSI